jgi:YD repeat-containing protein
LASNPACVAHRTHTIDLDGPGFTQCRRGEYGIRENNPREQSQHQASCGSVTGRSTTLGNTTTFYDARGSKIGSETHLSDTTAVYDAQGRRVGLSTTLAPPPSVRAFGLNK